MLYSFARLLLNYLGGEEIVLRLLVRSLPCTMVTHTFPFCCFRPWKVRFNRSRLSVGNLSYLLCDDDIVGRRIH